MINDILINNKNRNGKKKNQERNQHLQFQY